MGSPFCCCCGRPVKTVDRNQAGKSDVGDQPPGCLISWWALWLPGWWVVSDQTRGLPQSCGAGKARQAGGHPSGCIHVTGNSAISVFSFLLWHNQPNIGDLELSLKPKSFSGLVSKGGLNKSNSLITVTTCYSVYNNTGLFSWCVSHSLFGCLNPLVALQHGLRAEEKGDILGFVNALMNVCCHKSFEVVIVWSSTW